MNNIKPLEKSFIKNCDGLGDHQFTYIKHHGNVYMYRRDYMDGKLHSYEVFESQLVKEGAALPNGETVKQGYMKYVTSNSRAGTAYFCNEKGSADVRYDELIKKVEGRNTETTEDTTEEGVTTIVTKGKRGRKAVARPEIVLPTSKSFTMKDLLAINKEWNQPTLYLAVKKSSKIKVVGTQPNSGGRGKPAVTYSAV